MAQPLAAALLIALLAAHALSWLPLDPLRRLDGFLYDLRLRAFATAPLDERIVIVDIDERSMSIFGRWPWNRALLAELVQRIFEQEGAVLLGLDIILAEPDHSAGLPTLEALARGALRDQSGFAAALAELRPQLDVDARLAAELREHPVVLGFHLLDGPQAMRNGALPQLGADSLTQATQAALLPRLSRWPGHSANLPLLQEATGSGGFLTADVDGDGVTRRAPLLASVAGSLQMSLPLALLHQLLGRATLEPVFAGGRPSQADSGPLEALRLAGPRGVVQVPLSPDGRVLLPYAAPAGHFRYHAAADVLAGELPKDALRGRIVLLGTSAAGLLDQRSTPVGEAYPGVEAHANLLAALMDSRVLQQPGYAPLLDALAVLLLGAALAFALARLGLVGGLLASMGALALAVALNAAAWHFGRLVLPLAAQLLLVPSLFVLSLFFGFFSEARRRQRIVALFGQYVPPELVQRMSLQPEQYSMEGRSAELTVLFSDVRGFTTLSEKLPAAELAQLMNAYFSRITDIIRAHGGTLDKYVGDAVMAFWGAPVDDPQHALHAVQAALAMQAAMPALNAEFAARGWPALRAGIGINTGTMVVGDMGSRHRRAYTVLGDAVNLASRLEQLTAAQGVGILIGEATRAALPPWPCRELGRVAVRGRQAEVTLFEPLPAAQAPVVSTS